MDFIISRCKNKGHQLVFFPNGLAYFFGRNYEGLLKDSGMFCVHCLRTQCLWTQCLPSVGKTAAALGEMVPAAFISQDTSCTWSQQKSQLHQAHQPAGGGLCSPQGLASGGRAEGQLQPAQAARPDLHPPIVQPRDCALATALGCQPAKADSYTRMAIQQRGVWTPAAVNWGLRLPSLWSRLCLESCSDLLKINAQGELRRLQWP